MPEETREKLADLDWRGMAGMRDRLIQACFGVDYELVWTVVQNKIPDLRNRLQQTLDP